MLYIGLRGYFQSCKWPSFTKEDVLRRSLLLIHFQRQKFADYFYKWTDYL
jgi:hypothetical protein